MSAAAPQLRVVYEGHGERLPLGVLAHVQQRLVFEYSSQAIAWAQQNHVEFSALHYPIPKTASWAPFSTGPRHFDFLPGFIADALPDGWGLLLMDRALRKRGREPRSVGVLERLSIVGRAALGALSFEPVDESWLDSNPSVSLADIAQETQAVLNDSSESTPEVQLQRLLTLGGSPQGARPKVLLRRASDTLRFHPDAAGAGAGEPWLIKFPAQNEHPEVCAIEELYARLARKGGIDMPESEFFPLGRKASAFGVRRFDRLPAPQRQQPGPQEHRVPMQSMAAFLQTDYRLPSLDYETVMQAVWRITGDEREVKKAFHRCVFNVLTHNRDDHAKNFAFVLDAQLRWKLSPAFDLTYSFGPGGEHCTSVAGEGRWPGREQLLRVAAKGDLKPAYAREAIDHWMEALQADADLLQDLPIRSQTLHAMNQQLTQVWQRIRPQTHPMGQIHGQPKP